MGPITLKPVLNKYNEFLTFTITLKSLSLSITVGTPGQKRPPRNIIGPGKEVVVGVVTQMELMCKGASTTRVVFQG